MFPLWGLAGLSCSNEDDTPNCQGIDCLPEATQTGAGTFGCLVNGEPFYAFGGVQCQYQLIDGEYFFGVGFSRGCCFPRSIGIAGDNIQISQGSNFILSANDSGNMFAEIGFLYDANLPGVISNTTDSNNTGVLVISKFDQQNNIISGTFEFEILNPNDGQVYQITEGRFDSFYVE
jgi:hypothetical protein